MNLKDEYNKAFVKDLAAKFLTEASFFDPKSFIKKVLNEEWDNKELKERMRWITENIYTHINLSYPEQLNILLKIAPCYSGIQGFIFSDFVQIYGLNDLENSLKTIAYFTQYSSSEFAIRPFIEKYPSETMAQMTAWSLNENHHLRRLASEGCRPRLPWARPLRDFINDPTPTITIIENLKNDTSLYVRKSVANHINDISKDHPKLVLGIAKKWFGKHEHTNWIIKHGLRTLLKRGDKKALSIFGLDNSCDLEIANLSLSHSQITIGKFIYFEFSLINNSDKIRNIRLEYQVEFIKANKSTSGKVFQISEFNLAPYSAKKFKRKQWFKNLSTRKIYPGAHKITLIVNGDKKDNKTLNLIN